VSLKITQSNYLL